MAIDLSDTHTTIAGGLHVAALGGTWMTAVFGFAGLSLQSDGIALNPQLPARWQSLFFGIEWHGRKLKIRIDAADRVVQATLEAGEPMSLLMNGHQHEVRQGQAAAFHCRSPDLWLGVGHPKPNKYKTHKSGKAEREERSGVAQVIRYGSASRITECGPKPTGQTGHAHSRLKRPLRLVTSATVKGSITPTIEALIPSSA